MFLPSLAHNTPRCNHHEHQVLSSLSWMGLQSLSLYRQLFLPSSLQPDSVSAELPPPQGFPVAWSLHPHPPPRSAQSPAEPSALPLPAQPALGGPVSPTPSLLVSKKKRNSFSHLSLEQSPKGVEGHAVKCEKNKARACQAGQVVILIMWKFSTPTPVAIRGTTLFSTLGSQGVPPAGGCQCKSNYSCRPSSLPSSTLPHPQAAVDAPSGKNKLALNQATLAPSAPFLRRPWADSGPARPWR